MNTVLSPSGRRTVATPPAPALQRECVKRPELFDLPSPAADDASRGPLSPILGTTDLVTFDDIEAEDNAAQRFAKAAKKATLACQMCPFLQQCQDETYSDLVSGKRKRGEVVGAVAFNDEGLPDPAVHAKPKRRDLEQLSLDVELDIDTDPHDPYTDWVPADLEPLGLADDVAVELALDELKTNMVVSQTYLDRNPDEDTEGRIVLSYADEWEVVRRSADHGISCNRLAQILGYSWSRTSATLFVLRGEHENESFKPTAWDQAVRSVIAKDDTARRTRRADRVHAQRVRDRNSIRKHRLHRQTQRLAEATGTSARRPSRPLPVRVARVMENSSHATSVHT